MSTLMPELRAGGTDLSERRRSGVSHGEVIDIVPTPDMIGITLDANGSVHIGSMVTIAAIATHPHLRTAYPGFATAAGVLATPQIRAVGTLGGNLAQRSRCWYFRNPAFACLKKGGDICPARRGNQLYSVAIDLGPCIAPHPSTMGMVCMAYEAIVTTSRRKRLPVANFFGDGRDGSADNMLVPGEIIERVELPPVAAGERSVYRRATSRTHAEWPLVEAFVGVVLAAGRVSVARVAAGGIAPVPMKLSQVEDALLGTQGDAVTIARAAAMVRMSDSVPSINAYKLDLLEGLLVDLLTRVVAP